MVVYTALAIMPFHLRMARTIDVVYSWRDPWALGAVLFWVILLSVMGRAWRKQKTLRWGLAWFYAPLFFYCLFNIFFARRAHEMLLPEHNLYISYFGALIVLFSALELGRKKKILQKTAGVVFCGTILFFTVATIEQNMYWHDEVKLYGRIIRLNKDSAFNFLAYGNLAKAYEKAGQFDQAERYFKRGAKLSDKDPYFYNALAAFYLRRSQWDRAETILLFSKQLDPNFQQTDFLLEVVKMAQGRGPAEAK